MNDEKIKLVEPTVALKTAYLDLAREYLELQSLTRIEHTAAVPPIKPYPYEEAVADFPSFVDKMRRMSEGLVLPEGSVPMTTFWLVRDNKTILGHSAFRHRLTPALAQEGGHIGYSIRPSERRKGYGTLILALTLEKVYATGLRRVLVTCDTDNIGSNRIIRKNGGRLENEAVSELSGKRISRYWIALPGKVRHGREDAAMPPGVKIFIL